MYSAWDRRCLTGGVTPFGDPRMSLFSSNPWLIAGNHVLHRLSVPRHPPHALNSLVKNHDHEIHRNEHRGEIPWYRSFVILVFRLTLHSTVKDRAPGPGGGAKIVCGRRPRGAAGKNPVGGDERDRTVGLRLAKPALSQLSYIPRRRRVYAMPRSVV